MRSTVWLALVLALVSVFLLGQTTKYPAGSVVFTDTETLQAKADSGEYAPRCTYAYVHGAHVDYTQFQFTSNSGAVLGLDPEMEIHWTDSTNWTLTNGVACYTPAVDPGVGLKGKVWYHQDLWCVTDCDAGDWLTWHVLVAPGGIVPIAVGEYDAASDEFRPAGGIPQKWIDDGTHPTNGWGDYGPYLRFSAQPANSIGEPAMMAGVSFGTGYYLCDVDADSFTISTAGNCATPVDLTTDLTDDVNAYVADQRGTEPYSGVPSTPGEVENIPIAWQGAIRSLDDGDCIIVAASENGDCDGGDCIEASMDNYSMHFQQEETTCH